MRFSKKHLGLGLILSFSLSMMIYGNFLPSLVLVSQSGEKNEESSNLSLELAGYTTTDPIEIIGDAAFEAFNNSYDFCTGSGTWDDPYVISGISINANGEEHCVYIKSTRKNFTIKDSFFTKSGDKLAGIYIENVKNCTIMNNTLYKNGYGIQITNSSYCTITDNTFYLNSVGMRIIYGDNKICKDNLICKNYFGYSTVAQFQDKTTTNSLYNDTGQVGNYWTNIRRSFDKTRDNFTKTCFPGMTPNIVKNQTVKVYPVEENLNYTISVDVIDKYPLIANDTDMDGLDDIMEALFYGTNISLTDTDNDLMWDGWEAKNGLDPLDDGDQKEDPDEDDLANYVEFLEKYENENEVLERTDPNDADSDNDGWSDGKEVDEETSPTNPFDHPDYPPVATFQISFGFTYLIFLGIGISAVILYLKRKNTLV
ncbi:MAG: NosD domain-containing protein [Promethearchaeota archaeon]